mmetsp:Transcript_17527/g.47411  ORF Transcript_17527/g.47411 Transcript_17527/m.47411 type:complete len:200 (+) Transcript_17527:1058-1657(+)
MLLARSGPKRASSLSLLSHSAGSSSVFHCSSDRQRQPLSSAGTSLSPVAQGSSDSHRSSEACSSAAASSNVARGVPASCDFAAVLGGADDVGSGEGAGDDATGAAVVAGACWVVEWPTCCSSCSSTSDCCCCSSTSASCASMGPCCSSSSACCFSCSCCSFVLLLPPLALLSGTAVTRRAHLPPLQAPGTEYAYAPSGP